MRDKQREEYLQKRGVKKSLSKNFHWEWKKFWQAVGLQEI